MGWINRHQRTLALLVILLCLVLAVSWKAYLAGGFHSYSDVADISKLSSYIAALVVAVTIARSEDRKGIQRANIVIIGTMVACIILMIFHLSRAAPIQGLDGDNPSISFLNLIVERAQLVSLLPLVFFAILDLIDYTSSSSPERREWILMYLLFVDLTCLVPLAIVISIGLSLQGTGPGFEPENAELFIGGAVAFLVFAHAIGQFLAGWLTDKLRAEKKREA